MNPLKEKKFDIPELEGISEKTIEHHLELYSGYVKNANRILKEIPTFGAEVANELRRQFSFEYCGVRNHELYFEQFEGGPMFLDHETELMECIVEDFGSYKEWLSDFKQTAMTRGVGWAMLMYDKEDNLYNCWVSDQQIGQLANADIIVALDLWEHAYLLDGDKEEYIDAFFENLNWGVCAPRIINESIGYRMSGEKK